MHSVLFDVPVPGASWQEYFAGQGYHTFSLDMRGYGRSTRPKSMDLPARESPFICTHQEALQDISDVVEYITSRLQVEQITLCGLSWGGVLSCKFTNLHPHLVKSLILLGPVYSIQNPSWALFMDPNNPMQLNPNLGGYRHLGEDAIFYMWDAEMPMENKSLWRDPRVRDAIYHELLHADQIWAEKNNLKAFRVPNGVLIDIEDVYNKRPLYDPKKIECPTIIIRGDCDRASLKEDMDHLFEVLAAHKKYYVTIGGMTHYGLAEKRAPEMMAAAREFLKLS